MGEDDFREWKIFIVESLKKHEERLGNIDDNLQQILIDLTKLKTKIALWAGLGASIPTITGAILAVFSYFKGGN